MNTESAAKLTILAGNFVRLDDGRTGTVDEISGSIAVVEVAKPRTSRVAVARTYADTFDLVEVPVASLRFAN